MRSEVEEMVCQVRNLSPHSVVDLASGGGWFISRLLHNCRSIQRTISVERDLRCLWTLQYKFRVAKAEQRADAVGGDVRALPLMTEAFDVATCSNAFGELAGISTMFQEAHRVLRPGGHFLLCHSEKPWLVPNVSANNYRRIARKADIFVDKTHMLHLAVKSGFCVKKVVTTSREPDQMGRRFVADLVRE
ncbi:MAG: class I SAM-dependent methyltransferase [Phycisphaerae bacterium]